MSLNLQAPLLKHQFFEKYCGKNCVNNFQFLKNLNSSQFDQFGENAQSFSTYHFTPNWNHIIHKIG